MKRPDGTDPASISYRMRKRRFRIIDQLLHGIVAQKGEASVLDIGGRANYWSLMDPALRDRVHITVLNLEAELGTEAPGGLQVAERTGNGCAMPEFADGSFDLAHSNSVIEHVGSLSAMADFARESVRVGRGYYHQTPNLWFPVEPHYGVPFVHWLPGPVRARLLHTRKLGYSSRIGDYTRALGTVDHTQIVNAFLMRKLFPGGELRKERFLLLPKSIICLRPPPAG